MGSLAIVAATVVASYDWAQFNFDRVCIGQTSFGSGTYNVTIFENNRDNESPPTRNERIDVSSSTTVRVCDETTCCQEIGRLKWPPIPRIVQHNPDFIWMTEGQEKIVSIFGWFSVLVVASFLIGVFGNTVRTYVNSLVSTRFTNSSKGKDQKVDFSNLEQVGAYIPQISDPSLVYPLIACNIDKVPLNLLGFQVPENESPDDINVIFDVPLDEENKPKKMTKSMIHVDMISQHDEYELRFNPHYEDSPIFSIVKHWPFGGKYDDQVEW